MLGLTPLGAVHTAISLIAVAAGFIALWRYREISTRTLAVLAIALLAEYRRILGAVSRYVATVSYSLAFFFHFIPGTVETLTRRALQVLRLRRMSAAIATA